MSFSDSMSNCCKENLVPFCMVVENCDSNHAPNSLYPGYGSFFVSALCLGLKPSFFCVYGDLTSFTAVLLTFSVPSMSHVVSSMIGVNGLSISSKTVLVMCDALWACIPVVLCTQNGLNNGSVLGKVSLTCVCLSLVGVGVTFG